MLDESRRRLIEELMPIEAIGQESQHEKNLRHGHISTLHQWWSRKPLVASRAAVYATLLSAPANEKEHQDRYQELIDLGRWALDKDTLSQAQETLQELYKGRPPRLLDPFAGGGSIPLEALRLGCDVFGNDLNPVAHLIQQCTLAYPQRWGPHLADEIERWGEWVYQHVHEEVGDLYALPSPEADDLRVSTLLPTRSSKSKKRPTQAPPLASLSTCHHLLRPEATLWTRTIPCKNPTCGATVPLLSKSWLCKRKRRFLALQVTPNRKTMKVDFSFVQSCAETEAKAIQEWGFHPANFSRGGHTQCFHCGAGIEASYVRAQAKKGRMGRQLMALVCTQENQRGKRYITGPSLHQWLPSDDTILARLDAFCDAHDFGPPDDALPPRGSLGISVRNYGFETWKDLFLPRQMLTMLTFCKWVRRAYHAICEEDDESTSPQNPLATPKSSSQKADFARAVVTYLAMGVTKLANRGSALVVYNPHGEKLESPISNGRMAINWDVAEANPLGTASGNFRDSLRYTTRALRSVLFETPGQATLFQGPAQWLDLPDASIDAIVTDPPYYDNVPYSYLSDYFYIWFKRTLGPLYEDLFLRATTPKRRELVADKSLFQGDGHEAKQHFEQGMQQALQEMHRVLVPHGPLVVIYAHKTTAGWASLIDALRQARFTVTESWPLATERPSRLRAQQSAALASSIFLVTRKREDDRIGDYVREVRPQLQSIVRERTTTLFGLGLQGADLVLSCLGAGLRAFTQYAQVELPSGDTLSTEQFLQEVQREVVEQVLARVMGVQEDAQRQHIDPVSQFYVMARYQFGENPLPYDEANLLAKGLGLELEGARSLSDGKHAWVQKQKKWIHLHDFQVRGKSETLVQPEHSPSLLDLLHRMLWLSQHTPKHLPRFVEEHATQQESLRLLAQSLSGKFLTSPSSRGNVNDKRTTEQRQIDILLAAWPRPTVS